MIIALVAWFCARGGAAPRDLVFLLLFGLLLAAGGLGAWRALAAVERLVEAGATAARETERAGWQARLAESNAKAEAARSEAARAAARVSAEAEHKVAALRAALSELEKRHETLPDGARPCLDPGDLGDLERLRRHP